MADTPNLDLPLIAGNQNQKHVTHNEALRMLDCLVQLSVIDRDLTVPPVGPSDGDRYMVASGATGAWAAKDLNIAAWVDGAWIFFPPTLGWQCWIEDEALLLVYTGAPNYWVDIAAAGGFVTVTQTGNGSLKKVGINTAADNTNRLAVKSDAVLFSHDDVTPGNGNMLATLNKATAGDDAGFTFQVGFNTRALFGLLADSDWTVKVSPDGATFYTGLKIDKDNGAVSLVQHPKFSAYLNFGQNYVAAAWRDLLVNVARHNDQAALVIAANVGTFTAPHDGYYLFGIGATFDSPGTTPTKMQVGLSINGASPTSDTIGTTGDAALVTGETACNATAFLKLAAGDTVKPKIFFTTADGRVLASENYFWGAEVP